MDEHKLTFCETDVTWGDTMPDPISVKTLKKELFKMVEVCYLFCPCIWWLVWSLLSTLSRNSKMSTLLKFICVEIVRNVCACASSYDVYTIHVMRMYYQHLPICFLCFAQTTSSTLWGNHKNPVGLSSITFYSNLSFHFSLSKFSHNNLIIKRCIASFITQPVIIAQISSTTMMDWI